MAHCAWCGKPGPDPCAEHAEYVARRADENAALDAHLDGLTPEEMAAFAFSAEVQSPPRYSGRMHSGDLVKHLRGDVW